MKSIGFFRMEVSEKFESLVKVLRGNCLEFLVL